MTKRDDSYLPAQQRYNWGYAQWVIDSWNNYSKEIGLDIRAAKVKQNILYQIEQNKKKLK
jgi:hypothetical protein